MKIIYDTSFLFAFTKYWWHVGEDEPSLINYIISIIADLAALPLALILAIRIRRD